MSDLRSKQSGTYVDRPSCAVALQFFNKRPNIGMLYAGLTSSGVEEIIVIDDGSSDGSFQEWVELLHRPNDFLIRANDIFEVRTYDRVLRFTNADLLVLLQDDDELPADGMWIERAAEIFRQDPKLAILGGRDGLEILALDTANSSGTTFRDGIMRYRRIQLGSESEIEYVMAVNRAPMIVRVDAIRALGGLDQAFAPFQCDDVDVCLRAWASGWNVALYDPGFRRRNVGEGGMRLYNMDLASIQASRNWSRIYQMHASLIVEPFLRERIAQLNGDRTDVL